MIRLGWRPRGGEGATPVGRRYGREARRPVADLTVTARDRVWGSRGGVLDAATRCPCACPHRPLTSEGVRWALGRTWRSRDEGVVQAGVADERTSWRWRRRRSWGARRLCSRCRAEMRHASRTGTHARRHTDTHPGSWCPRSASKAAREILALQGREEVNGDLVRTVTARERRKRGKGGSAGEEAGCWRLVLSQARLVVKAQSQWLFT